MKRNRYPLAGIDARPTSNADHAREADAVACLTIALITLGALVAITLVATR